MGKKMTFFCIITNSDKKDNYDKALNIKKYLEEKKCRCEILENRMTQSAGIRHFTDIAHIDKEFYNFSVK